MELNLLSFTNFHLASQFFGIIFNFPKNSKTHVFLEYRPIRTKYPPLAPLLNPPPP